MTSGLYHVNEEGNPGRCSAKSGNCPFGGEDSHFTSAEAARHSYEENQSKKEQAVQSWKRKPVSKPQVNPEPVYTGHGSPRGGHGMPDLGTPTPSPRAKRTPKPSITAPSTGHGNYSGHGRPTYSTGHGNPVGGHGR